MGAVGVAVGVVVVVGVGVVVAVGVVVVVGVAVVVVVGVAVAVVVVVAVVVGVGVAVAVVVAVGAVLLKAPENERMVMMTNRSRNFLLSCWGLVLGLIAAAATTGCGGVSIPPQVLNDCRLGATQPPEPTGYSCRADPRGLGYPWTWQKNADPDPVPTPSPLPPNECQQDKDCPFPPAQLCRLGPKGNNVCVPVEVEPVGECQSDADCDRLYPPPPPHVCRPTGPQGSNRCVPVEIDPPCEDKPPVCTKTVERVCVNAEDREPATFPFIERDPANGGNPNCWTWPTYQDFMIRNGYYTESDPKEDGDAAGRPGFWLNYDAQQVLVELIRKSDGMRVDPNNGVVRGTSINPPYMEKREVETCTPGVKCDDPPPPPGCAAPSNCPALTRWGVSPNPHFTHDGRSVADAYVGGKAHWDSTPRFGGGANGGQPCNDEHHEPCTSTVPGCSAWRRCEDPRGPLWTFDGPAELVEDEGFGIQLKFTGEGKVTVTACPHIPARDELGQPVATSAAACSSRFVTVKPR